MEVFAFLAIAYAVSDPQLGYSAKVDRDRFPRDEVFREWKKVNQERRCELERMKANAWILTLRPGVREDYVDDLSWEIGELDRIWNIMHWMEGQYADEYTMRCWMRHARDLLTEEEYQSGYFTFGGLLRR